MGTSRAKTAVIAALTLTLPTVASSQGGAGSSGTTPAVTGGLQVDVGVRTGISFDDNFTLRPGGGTGSSSIWDTNLSFGISNITQNQSLVLTGNGVLRFASIPGRSIAGFEDPNLRFRYVLDSLNSRLTVDASYRNADREFLDPFQVEREQQQSTGLTGNGGTATWQNARLTYETGLNDPIGFKLDLSHAGRNYANVPNPSYFDNTTDSIGVTGIFALSQVTRVTAAATLSAYDAQDALQTKRDTTDVTLGLTQDVSAALRLDAQVGYTVIDTDLLGIRTRRDGATGSLGLVRQLSNGSASVNVSSSLNSNGGRTTLSFGRTMQLPTGNLGATVGLTQGPGGSTDAVGTLTYDRTLRSANYNVSLSRSATTNTANAEVIDTRLSVGYGYQINGDSRIDLTLDWGLQEDGGAGSVPTVKRTNLRAAYTRALTADWNLQGGVLLRRLSDSSVTGDAASNSVFVSLDRNFSFRP